MARCFNNVCLRTVLLAWLFLLCSMQAHSYKFEPIWLGTITDDFADVYQRFSRRIKKDKTEKLIAFGSDSFAMVSSDYKEEKTCKTIRKNITNAHYSPSENYIVTTSHDGVVDIYDTSCQLQCSIKDQNRGIFMGVFGESDNVVITNSIRDTETSRMWVLPPHTLMNPTGLVANAYVDILKDYLHARPALKNYQNFIRFIAIKNHPLIGDMDIERDIFDGFDADTRKYLRYLIKDRPGSKARL